MPRVSVAPRNEIDLSPGSIFVAVDVIRFSTTAAVLAGRFGSFEVGPPDEAFIAAWKGRHPSGVVLAELGGRKLKEAHFDNSPHQASLIEARGRPVLLGSTNGATLILSLKPLRGFVASLCNLTATARILNQVAGPHDHLIIAPASSVAPEDVWCAEILRRLLQEPDLAAGRLVGPPEEVLKRLRRARPDCPAADLKFCAALDAFNFGLRIRPGASGQGPLIERLESPSSDHFQPGQGRGGRGAEERRAEAVEHLHQTVTGEAQGDENVKDLGDDQQDPQHKGLPPGGRAQLLDDAQDGQEAEQKTDQPAGGGAHGGLNDEAQGGRE